MASFTEAALIILLIFLSVSFIVYVLFVLSVAYVSHNSFILPVLSILLMFSVGLIRRI